MMDEPGSFSGMEISPRPLRGPLARILEPAIALAENGFPTSKSQAETTAEFVGELKALPGFAEAFMPGGAAPKAGDTFHANPVIILILSNGINYLVLLYKIWMKYER